MTAPQPTPESPPHYARDTSGTYAGTHILADLYDCRDLDSCDLTRLATEMADAVEAAVLKTARHKFPGHGGETVLLLLAESHISIHTWPETGYVAADIFTCGRCQPQPAIEVLINRLRPATANQSSSRRGAIDGMAKQAHQHAPPRPQHTSLARITS